MELGIFTSSFCGLFCFPLFLSLIESLEDGKMKLKKKKPIHELAKQFPLKTYRELEKYRDADRWEEAIGIGHNHPPKDDVTKDDPDNHEYE
jgi:hypothetical protein